MAPSADKRRSPRILIVAEWFYPTEGGSQRVTHNFADALARRGWQVTVYTRAMPGSEEFDRSVSYHVRRSRTWALLWDMNLRGGHASRIGRALTSLYLTLAFWRRRWDAMVGMHLVPMAFPGRVMRWIGRPVVVWTYGEEIEVGMRTKMMRMQVKSSLRMAHAVVTISRDTERMITEAGAAPQKIIMQFPCPDRSFFEPVIADRDELRRTWLDEEAFLLVTISRLAERKGIDTVLRALANLCRRQEELNLKPWIYLIGGVGEDKARLRELVAEFGLHDRVRFVGSLSEPEKRDLIEAADLFVMPNRELPNGEKEGFGIVFVEAALRGTPSLGGRSGGTADAIAEGTSGWLVDPASPDETEHLLAEILANPEKAAALRPGCRPWALKTFKPHLRHDEVVSRLKGLIHKKVTRASRS